MGAVIDAIEEWIKDLLIHGICGVLLGTFEVINEKVGEVAGQVAKTPSEWHGGIFALIENLSMTVILPIAGLILTYVMVYELINMIIDRNNFHDFAPSEIMKWIFKTYISIILVSNVFTITMAVFDVGKHVVEHSGAVIMADTAVDPYDAYIPLRAALETQSNGSLMMIFVQSLLLNVAMEIIAIVVTVVIYGRMIEIYMVTSLAPVPFSTLMNKEQSSMGQNYFKSLLALAFQGFLIMVCVGIYAVLIQSVGLDIDPDNPLKVMWDCLTYSILLCFTLLKSASMAKGIFNAH